MVGHSVSGKVCHGTFCGCTVPYMIISEVRAEEDSPHHINMIISV